MARRKKPQEPPALVDIADQDVERYAGQWVAVKDGRVIFGSPNGAEVWDWLDEHDVEDVTIIRIRAKNEPTLWIFGSLQPNVG